MSATTVLDANQVIKKTYDDATGGVLMVPIYTDTTVLVNAVLANANFTSTPVNVLAFKTTGVMISWSGLTAADASIQFQGSVDGVVYENLGSAVALVTASGQKGVSFIDEPYKFIQAVYSHGTNSAGTITMKYIQRA